MEHTNESNIIRAKMRAQMAVDRAQHRTTIDKQFFTIFFDKNPYATDDAADEAYTHFCADVTGAYQRADYSSVKLAEYLLDAYNIDVSPKTILNWLKDHGVTIQQPTRERERLPRTTWEKNLYDKIENLESKLKEAEKQKEIAIHARDETIDVLRKQRKELVDENCKMRVEVGRLMRVVGTLKYQK